MKNDNDTHINVYVDMLTHVCIFYTYKYYTYYDMTIFFAEFRKPQQNLKKELSR